MMRSAPGTAAAPRRLLLFLGLSAAAALSYCGEPAAAAPSLVSRLATRFDNKDRKFIEKAIEERTPEKSLLAADEAGYLAGMREMRRRSSKHLIIGSTLFGGGTLLGNLVRAAAVHRQRQDAIRAQKRLISLPQYEKARKARFVGGLISLALLIVAFNGFVYLIKAGRRASDSKKLRQRAIDLLRERAAAAEYAADKAEYAADKAEYDADKAAEYDADKAAEYGADKAAEYGADTAAANVSLHGQTRQTIGMEDRPIL